MEIKKPTEKVKFYADCPDGTKNKQFNYKTHDISHSHDLLNKFVANGFKIRMAWHHYPETGKQINLKAMLPKLDGDITGSYSNLKKLEAAEARKNGNFGNFISGKRSTPKL